MFESIPNHGSPHGKAFGVLGDIFESDVGIAYVKKNNDTLNIGWGLVDDNPYATPTPTPSLSPAAVTPPPTPTISNTPGISPTPTPTISNTPGISPTPVVSSTPAISSTPAVTPSPSPSSPTLYNLSVNGGQNGISGTTGSGNYPAGTLVYIEGYLESGIAFDYWSDFGTAYLQDGGINSGYTNPNHILMPSQNEGITPIGYPVLGIGGNYGNLAWTTPYSVNINSTADAGQPVHGDSVATHTIRVRSGPLPSGPLGSWTDLISNSNSFISTNYSFPTDGLYQFEALVETTLGYTKDSIFSTVITAYAEDISALSMTPASLSGPVNNPISIDVSVTSTTEPVLRYGIEAEPPSGGGFVNIAEYNPGTMSDSQTFTLWAPVETGIWKLRGYASTTSATNNHLDYTSEVNVTIS